MMRRGEARVPLFRRGSCRRPICRRRRGVRCAGCRARRSMLRGRNPTACRASWRNPRGAGRGRMGCVGKRGVGRPFRGGI